MKSRLWNTLGKLRGKDSGTARRRPHGGRRVLFEYLEDRRLLSSTPINQLDPSTYVPNQLLVRFTPDTTVSQWASILSARGGQIVKRFDRLDMVLAQVSGNLATTASQLDAHPKVLYAEPNYWHIAEHEAYAGVFPNDPYVPQQWALHNGGQTPGQGLIIGSTADADIDAPEAWTISVGTSDVVVAIIDTGVDYTHPDLMANMWVNPGEVDGDGADNDGNGYIDDVYGIDVDDGDSDPDDTEGHGTHVAGIAAATGDNGRGITGVSWNAKIMSVRAIGANTTSATLIEAYDYVAMMKTRGVNIVAANNSYNNGNVYAQAEEDAIAALIDTGVVFVCSAGNAGADNDIVDHYPSDYELDGIIAVAATDKNDNLTNFSNYGATTVHLGAPGEEILSTVPRSAAIPISDPTGYMLLDGTSMATPHVTGALAVLRGLDPTLSVEDAIDIIIGGVDPLPGLTRTTISGGRLNLYNSLNMITAGEVRGTLWNDQDSDGRIDALETGIAGWTVFLDLDSDGRLDSGETSTITAQDGTYRLPNFRGPGTYTVSVLKKLLYTQTYPSGGLNRQTVTFSDRDQVVMDVDFGYRAQPGSISGVKWLDEDGSGERETGEPGLKDWTIYVDVDRDGRLDVGEPSATTDFKGQYRLTNVPAGTVWIREVAQPGYTQTYPGDPFYHEKIIQPATEIKNVDFGNDNSEANDFGDAPRPYPTLLASNGARHGILAGVHLGPSVDDGGVGLDGEPDGFQNASNPTLTDDTDNLDDEDGVTFDTQLSPGGNASVTVTVSLDGNPSGKLQAWIDFNGDGDWSDTGEQIVKNRTLGEGVHTISFAVPAAAKPGQTYARFRYGYENDLGPVGASYVGEVEDYAVAILSDQPIANDDQFTVDQDSLDNALTVLANDVPSSSGLANLRLSSVNAAGASGTARISDNGTPADYTDDLILYTPAPGAFAPDAFTYTVTDAVSGRSDSATVAITITPFAGSVPIALDDSFAVSTTTDLDVLKNDRRGPTGVIQIPTTGGLNTSGTVGTVTLVTVGTSQRVRYAPAAGFFGTDQFKYTIRDANNVTSTATVTIHVPPHTQNDLVRYRVVTMDMSGQPISQIGQGLQFQVLVYAKDMRNEPGHPALDPGLTTADQGVFSGYLDMLYDDSLVSYAGNLTFGPSYPAGRYFSARVPGILDESGAFQGAGSAPLGPDEQLLYTATFTADAKGTAVFSADPADNLPLHETALNKPPEPAVDIDRIEYGTASISIVDSPDLVRISLQLANLNGTPLAGPLTVGSDFLVQAYVDDLRNIANEGVYSAYLDIFYDKDQTRPVYQAQNELAITYGPLFTVGQSGMVSADGIIDEAGAVQGGSTPQSFTGKELLFSIRFTAYATTGYPAYFTANPADNLPLHETTILPTTSVPTSQIDYVSIPSVFVTSGSGEAEFSNPRNRFDVNNDGYTSPVDVLLEIDFLNNYGSLNMRDGAAGEGEAATQYFFDVNRDWVVSPLDVLNLISYLNLLAAGEGEAAADIAAPVSLAPAADLAPVGATLVATAPDDAATNGPGLPWVDPFPAIATTPPAANTAESKAADAVLDQLAAETPDLETFLSDDFAEDVLGAWITPQKELLASQR